MNGKEYYINEAGQGILRPHLTEIPEYAFSGRKELKSIHIPGHILTINYRAFENCVNLETVTFEEGLTCIDCEAFLNCYSLKKLCLPDSAEDVYCNLFYGTGITEPVYNTSRTILHYYPNTLPSASFIVPSTVRQIMPTAFGPNANLKDVYIPDGLEMLNPNTFCNSFVQRVVIPKTVQDLRFCFYNCPDLREVILEGKIDTKDAFHSCPEDIKVIYKRITATSRLYELYTPLANPKDIRLPQDLSYTQTAEFKQLAQWVADGEIDALAILSDYFWDLHFHYPNDFFVWAAQLWNYQHAILSYSLAPAFDVLPVDTNYVNGTKLIAGNVLYCLGLTRFSQDAIYRFHPTANPDIVLVSSPCMRGGLLDSYADDGFDAKTKFDWTYMDNRMLTPLGETLYHYSFYEPIEGGGVFLEAAAEALRILKKKYRRIDHG